MNNLTPEEIAYWASQGYYYDPAYATATGPSAATGVYGQPQQQQQQYYPQAAGVHGTSSRHYTGGGAYGNNGGYSIPTTAGGAGAGSTSYQDLNSIFEDPTKAIKEAKALEAEKQKAEKDKAAATVIRSAAGLQWEDPSLLEFDENDFRLFAGDLGNEITDELLEKTFSKYPSLLKAKVVRDKRTLKSKGYGFISFGNADDFAKAWKEMNGKYVGNRPIKLRKSQWKDRNVEIVRESRPTRAYDAGERAKKERAKPYKVKKLNNEGK